MAAPRKVPDRESEGGSQTLQRRPSRKPGVQVFALAETALLDRSGEVVVRFSDIVFRCAKKMKDGKATVDQSLDLIGTPQGWVTDAANGPSLTLTCLSSSGAVLDQWKVTEHLALACGADGARFAFRRAGAPAAWFDDLDRATLTEGGGSFSGC